MRRGDFFRAFSVIAAVLFTIIIFMVSCKKVETEGKEAQCPKNMEVIDPQTSMRSGTITLDSEKETKINRIIGVWPIISSDMVSFLVETAENHRAVTLTASPVQMEFIFDVVDGDYRWALITFDKATGKFTASIHVKSIGDVQPAGTVLIQEGK